MFDFVAKIGEKLITPWRIVVINLKEVWSKWGVVEMVPVI